MSHNITQPSHYARLHNLDPATIIDYLPYWLGAALKYAWRAPLKNGAQDLTKCADCLRRYKKAIAKHAGIQQHPALDATELEDVSEKLTESVTTHGYTVGRILRLCMVYTHTPSPLTFMNGITHMEDIDNLVHDLETLLQAGDPETLYGNEFTE